MNEIVKLSLGVAILVLGYFLGDITRRQTQDEQKDGQKYFLIITIFGLILGFLGLIVGKDWLMFSAFFVSIFTAQNLKNKRRK